MRLKTPVPQLLRTNDEPTTQESVSIRRIVQDAETNLQNIMLDSKKARRHHADIATFIHAHNTLLSVIRRVPIEIWEQIFYHVALSKDTGSIEMTLRLRQVCRLWNIAAKSTKSLPELLAVLPPVRLEGRTARASFIHSMQQRVHTAPNTCPLSIRILDPIKKDVHPVVQLLIAHRLRWGYLSVSIDPSAIRSASLSFQFTYLRRLQLHIPSTRHDVVETLLFLGSPLLTEVEVDCLVHIRLLLPWQQLVKYKERSSGRGLGWHKCCRQGSAIEQLEYRTSDLAAVASFKGPKVSQWGFRTSLRKIDIRLYHNSTTAFPILDQITAPYLQDIRIKDHSTEFIPILLDFFHRSDCGLTLTSLILYTSCIKEGDFTKMLGCTPMLTKLECNDIPIVDFRLLSEANGTVTLIPLLHDLVIHSPSLAQLDLDMLVKNRSQTSVYQPESVGGNGSPQAPPQAPPQAVRSFSVKLVFSEYRRCKHAIELLVPGAGDDLSAVRSKISDNLAELDIQVDQMKMNSKERDTRQFHALLRSISSDHGLNMKLNKVITYLETAPLEKMPESIHWAIHVLNRFRVLGPEIVPQNGKYNFLSRAGSLVYAWKDFRRQQSQSLTSNWILHGRLCLMFVGGMTALRTTNDSETQSLPWWDWKDEKYQIGEDKDVLWAQYDFSEYTPISDYLSWRRNINFK